MMGGSQDKAGLPNGIVCFMHTPMQRKYATKVAQTCFQYIIML